MKQFILSLIASLSITLSIANPLYRPQTHLEKLSFTENSKWEMLFELNYPIDSFTISSSTTIATYQSNLIDYRSELLLNYDSLNPKVSINQEGDSISIISYFTNRDNAIDSLFETIVFGNYSGAKIPKPLSGQSIIRIFESEMNSNHHCLINSNDKISGTITGKIYDKNNQLITSGSFNIDPFPVYRQCMDGSYGTHGTDVSFDGKFSINCYSQNYEMNSVNICGKRGEADNCLYYVITESVEIKPLQITLYPDSTIQIDIHLLEDYVSINKIKITEPDIIKIFPNPVSSSELQYEISVPVKSTNCIAKIYSLNGKEILISSIKQNRGSITLPTGIANGSYLFQLCLNGKVYKNQQFTIKRQ